MLELPFWLWRSSFIPVYVQILKKKHSRLPDHNLRSYAAAVHLFLQDLGGKIEKLGRNITLVKHTLNNMF